MSILGLIVAIILAVILFKFLAGVGGILGIVLIALAIWLLVSSRRGATGV